MWFKIVDVTKLLICAWFFQPNSPMTPLMSRKALQPYYRKLPDEEDNWSVASSYPLFGVKKLRYDAMSLLLAVFLFNYY